MITRVSYKTVVERHPEELEELRKLIYKSRSKYKNRPTSDWRFAYDWHILTTDEKNYGYYAYRSYSKWPDNRIVEKVVDQAKNVHIELIATPSPKGRSGTQMVTLFELPDEVLLKILLDEVKIEVRRHGSLERYGGRARKRTLPEIHELFVRVRKELPAKKKKPVTPQVKKDKQPVKRDKYEAVKV
jgi:hypothetical protein